MAMWLSRRGLAPVAYALAALGSSAFGQVVIPGADGSDGAFSPVASVQVDLTLADTQANWETAANPNPGEGVYDPNRWAVVYRFSSVNIPAGVTVTFRNYAARAPVVWLVSGSVTIAGTISHAP